MCTNRLPGRLVEAELLLELPHQLGIDAARAARRGRRRRPPGARRDRRRPSPLPRRGADPRGGLAGMCPRSRASIRSTGPPGATCTMSEVDEHDPEQRRHDEQAGVGRGRLSRTCDEPLVALALRIDPPGVEAAGRTSARRPAGRSGPSRRRGRRGEVTLRDRRSRPHSSTRSSARVRATSAARSGAAITRSISLSTTGSRCRPGYGCPACRRT